MNIKQEQPKDFLNIYNLVKTAFETAKVSNGNEQDYVNRLRASDGYIPELALVAEENGKLVGHIMLTKTYVAAVDSKFEALLLAPLAVALEHRNRGIGSKLVKRSLELAKSMGFKAVFVVGDPAYYSRFGFKPSALYGITHIPEIPSENVMVHELFPSALTGVRGTVSFIS